MWEFLNYSRAVGLKLFECQINWRVDKTDYWALPSRVLNSVCLGWGLTICISDNFPGDTWCSWSREPHSENHCFREPGSWGSFGSVQFSGSVVSDSLRAHELQHARPSCPSPTPRVYPNSYPLNQWCHPTISSSVVPFSSCPQFSQHQGLFKWINSLHQVAKALEFQLQDQSFQWIPRTDLL